MPEEKKPIRDLNFLGFSWLSFKRSWTWGWSLSGQIVGILAVLGGCLLHYFPALATHFKWLPKWFADDFSWEVTLLLFVVIFLPGWLREAYGIYKQRDCEADETEKELNEKNLELIVKITEFENKNKPVFVIAAEEKLIVGSGSIFAPAAEQEKRCRVSVKNIGQITANGLKIELVDVLQDKLKRNQWGNPHSFPLLLHQEGRPAPTALNPGEDVLVDLLEARLTKNLNTGEPAVSVRLAQGGVSVVLDLDAEFRCQLRVTANDLTGIDSNYQVKFSASTHKFTLAPSTAERGSGLLRNSQPAAAATANARSRSFRKISASLT